MFVFSIGNELIWVGTDSLFGGFCIKGVWLLGWRGDFFSRATIDDET